MCKRAIKKHIHEVFCAILLPLPPSHSPNLRGWLHNVYRGDASSRKELLAKGGGAAIPEAAEPGQGYGDETESQHAKRQRQEEVEVLQALSNELTAQEMHDELAGEETSGDALTYLDESGGDGPTPMDTTSLPFKRPAQDPAIAQQLAAQIASRPPQGRAGVTLRAVPVPAAANATSFTTGAAASTTTAAASASTASTSTTTTATTAAAGSPSFESRMHAAFKARVDVKRKAGAQHPEREAIKGASFTSRSILDPGERQLMERISRLRPPRHPRPVEQKMKERGLSPLTLDEYLKDSKLKPMPSSASPIDSSGLATSLLNHASSAETVHVRLQGAGRSSVSSDTSASGGFATVKQLVLERYMREAVEDSSVTVTDMLAELRVALMDRMRYELATFHARDFGSEVLIRQGHWFVQCPPHKYKNLVQAIKRLEAKDEDVETKHPDQLSKRRLQEVADDLVANATSSDDRKRFQTLQLALVGGTDMQSQAACIYLLICPEFLAALSARDDCWREHTILYIFGQAWMAWDRPHLSHEERVRAIESYEALLCFNLAGEQIYLPFLNETTKGANPGLKGILSGEMGSFASSQNLLAFLSNGAVHRQFREQYPDEYVHAVERSFHNNDVETFHSEITQQLGIKPTMRNLQGRLVKIDFAMRQLFDPERPFHITLSRRKMYDPVEFYLAHNIMEWNDGSAIDLQSESGQKYLRMVAERAMNSAKGKQESIRSHFNRANKIVRDSIRALEVGESTILGANPKAVSTEASAEPMDTSTTDDQVGKGESTKARPSRGKREAKEVPQGADPAAKTAAASPGLATADTRTAESGRSQADATSSSTTAEGGRGHEAGKGNASCKRASGSLESTAKRQPSLMNHVQRAAASRKENEQYLESLGLPPIGNVDSAKIASLPWLDTADLELSARVIDYWQGGHAVSTKLADYLCCLGFEVPAEPVKRWQTGVSCGIVAAEAVTIMREAEQQEAGGWLEADTTGATDLQVIKAANQSQREWARPEELLSPQVLRRNPAHTRFLVTSDVHCLTTQRWKQVKAPRPDEDLGPPCARCDQDHESKACLHFNSRRGNRFGNDTVTVTPLDAAYAQIVRELHAAATADPFAAGYLKHAPWPRYLISNNKKT